MAKNIPEIDDLIKGINDPEITLTDKRQDMLKYQDESGMWYQVVNFGGMDKNYLETSGSSIMAYALLKGVRLGFLSESYRAYGEKAFHGICDNYLSTDENGISTISVLTISKQRHRPVSIRRSITRKLPQKTVPLTLI